MTKIKVGIILGTRPEIIKLSPIIRILNNNEYENIEHFVLYTNQHYSKNMGEVFFSELNLPSPNYLLSNKNYTTHGQQMANMVIGIENILLKEKPDVVIVQGDTNSVLSGAITSSKMGIDVAHVESGLRSFDKSMPEEINRIITDHLSKYLFAPTDISKKNLINENITENIYVVGNTIVDALNYGLNVLRNKYPEIEDKTKSYGDYFLLTIHRAENTDNPNRLKNIVESVVYISNHYSKILFPVHPRTLDRLKKYNLLDKLKSGNIELIPPVGYYQFLSLEKNAKLILTDSGGVQEESCILKVPCITLRDNTERPETISVGSNVLVGTDKDLIITNTEKMLKSKKNWNNPFGSGDSAYKILDILEDCI